MTSTTLPQLSQRHLFGVKSDVRQNFWFKEEQNYVYAAGDTIVSYFADQKVQQFMQSGEKLGGITAMCCSPNRRYLAVAERSDRGVVSVYDMVSLRRKRVLPSAPELVSSEYVCMAFSPDNKMLITLGGGPDWKLVYWHWDKMKPVATVSVSNPAGSPVTMCSFSPEDDSHVCVTGNGIFKLYKIVDGIFKLVSQSVGKREPQNYVSHAWLSRDRILIGTDTGELLLTEGGDFKQVLPQSPSDGQPIECITPFSRGFLLGSSAGTLHIFEKSDEGREQYRRVKTLKIQQQPSAKITHIAVSPSEDTLVCSLDTAQLYAMSLSGTIDDNSLQPLFSTFHSAPITGMDVCVRKPLIATCSVDRTIRVWNYIERALECSQVFNEEVYSVSFHPSGHYLLVGFADKLKLMSLLIDDIRAFHEFPIKACRECRFSNGGQFFAAANNNTIQVFNFYTFENVCNLRGHSGKISSLYWSADDTRLISAGVDGAVYRWRLSDQKRDDEYVSKGCQYTSALCSPDLRSIYAVGSDKKLKELADGASPQAFLSPVALTQLALSHSGRMLFAGTETGSLRSYKFPPTEEYAEFVAHAGAVTRLAISLDDQYLFTAGADGVVGVWDVRDKDARAARRDREAEFSQEVLVNKVDLDEKMAKVNELQVKVDNLTSENEIALKLRDLNHQEELRRREEEHRTQLETMKIKYDLLLQEKNDKDIEYSEKLQRSEEQHAHIKHELEQNYERKLSVMNERERELQQQILDLKQLHEEMMQAQKAQYEREIQEMKDDYENREHEDKAFIDQLIEEKNELAREFEETKRQLEEDADREIEELKDEYERRLAAERKDAVSISVKHAAMQKSFAQLQKELKDSDDHIKMLESEKQNLELTIQGLHKDMLSLKKEIKERDETIGDKETRIWELKKKNQELEKFKFVLDYKIKELKKQIEPREVEIADMKTQIKDMDTDLVRYHRTKSALELQIGDLKMKLEGMQHEIVNERRRAADLEALVRRMRTDIHEATQHIQDPKALKDAVRQLYQKHVSESLGEHGLDVDIQREYTRQREYLERTVSSLKTKLAKQGERHKQDSVRVLQENVALIKEINELRRELKGIRMAQRQREMFGKTKKEPTEVDASWPLEAVREIEMQRDEIARLRARIEELESNPALSVQRRPISRERLPPLDGEYESVAAAPADV